ncbi:MAG: hypothetical protein U0746_19850 [Gemmataceae bacterium]
MRPLLGGLIVVALQPSIAVGLDRESERLLAEIRQALQAQDLAGLHLDISYSASFGPAQPDRPPAPSDEGTIRIDGANGLYRQTLYVRKRGEVSASHRVNGRNADYAFTLTRAKDDEPYVVARMSRPDGPDDHVARMATHTNGWLLPWSAGYVRLDTLLSGTASEIRRVQKLAGANGSAIKVECRYVQPPSGDAREDGPRDIVFVVDPPAACRVQTWELVQGAVGTRTATNEYSPDAGGLPVLKSTSHKTTYGNGSVVVFRCDFAEWKYRQGPLPDSAYRLPAFDLPEPPQSARRPHVPIWTWLFLAGLVSIGVGAFFRNRARRSAATP